MSKKTSTKTTTKSTKPTPDRVAPANDKARANALVKLNAAHAVNARKPSRSKPQATRPSSSPRRTLRSNSEPKRLSALDAAAQVLALLPAKETRAGLGAHDLIERMAAAGLWTSPGGKTPEATLYAAVIREITAKGKDARFKKVDRGMFAASGKGR